MMQKVTMKDLLKRFGVAGFLFFLVKGLFWLALPAYLLTAR